MSRRLLLSSISIAATVTLLGAGAFAKFSDTETSTTHSVTAGSLDLRILNADQPDASYPEYGAFAVTNAAPGDSSAGATKYVHFKNVGTLPGKLSVKVVMVTNDENTILAPETAVGDSTDGPGNGELGAAMLVSIDGIGAMINQPLTALDAAAPSVWGNLAAGAEGWVSIDWSIPVATGNQIMSDSASFKLVFTLEQL